MIPIPAASRSATSSRSASATWFAVSPSGWSSRTKDHARIVTGPVSMPLTGLSVRDWAWPIHGTVNASPRRPGPSRLTSPHRIDGRVQREP